MFRRSLLILLLFSASLAVVAYPAAAQLHHRHPMARSWVPGSNIRPHPVGKPKDPDVPWWIPLIEAIPTLLFMFGAVPGIIASSKGIPHWKSYFWRGLFFGFLFFPVVMVLIYQIGSQHCSSCSGLCQGSSPAARAFHTGSRISGEDCSLAFSSFQ